MIRELGLLGGTGELCREEILGPCRVFSIAASVTLASLKNCKEEVRRRKGNRETKQDVTMRKDLTRLSQCGPSPAGVLGVEVICPLPAAASSWPSWGPPPR